MTIIDLLIAVIVLVVVIYVAKLVLDMVELPPPIRTIVMLIIGLVVLFIVLSWFGLADGLTTRRIN